MTNALITGASGLIGRNITTFLISKGFKVYALSRFKKSTPSLKTLTWISGFHELDGIQCCSTISTQPEKLQRDHHLPLSQDSIFQSHARMVV